jgi:Outer membrane protein beta-barrel domain
MNGGIHSAMSFNKILAAPVLWIALSPLTYAQLTANFGAGLSFPTGNLSEAAEPGMGINVGAGWRFGSHFATLLAFASNSLGVKEFNVTPEKAFGFTSASIWSLTLDPSIRFNTKRRIQPYIVGGYGLYSLHQPFRDGALLKGGANAGAGVDFEIAEGSSLYFEVRVSRIMLRESNLNYVPFIFGFRWH